MDLFTLALNFFLIANPIGNIPTIVALVKEFPFERQKLIVLREGIFAFLIAIGFQYAGTELMSLLQIQSYTISIAGGLLLTLVALGMIFPKPEVKEVVALKNEPFCRSDSNSDYHWWRGDVVNCDLLFDHPKPPPCHSGSSRSWCGILPIMLVSPYLKKILGDRGLLALEQLMGMVLALLSMRLIVQGFRIFVTGS